MFKIDDGSVGGVVCSVCNSQPTKDEFAIDTEVPFIDPNQKHLGMRHRIVCQRCAEELVTLVPDKQKDKFKSELSSWKARYGTLVAALDTLSKDVLRVSD